ANTVLSVFLTKKIILE
ncbi:putative IS protein, partial [Escherichia coli 10.0833]